MNALLMTPVAALLSVLSTAAEPGQVEIGRPDCHSEGALSDLLRALRINST